MNEAELFVEEQIKTLVPNYDTIKLEITVHLFNARKFTRSFSLEFFATVDGKKMQCFEMIDQGMFTENDFDSVSSDIAEYFTDEYSDEYYDNNYEDESEVIKKYTVYLKDDEVNIEKYTVYKEDTVYPD